MLGRLWASVSMLELISGLIFAFVAMLVATRLTSHPFRAARARAVEASANTYAEVEVQLPFVGLVGPGGGRAQAIELGKIFAEITAPDIEDDQRNSATANWLRDSDTQTRTWNERNCIWRDQIEVDNDFTTSGSSAVVVRNTESDMQVDGRGEILAERSIFLAIQGAGNVGTMSVESMILAHLTEMQGNELIAQLFADDL